MTALQWVGYTAAHPVEGFSDMRWKKAGSLKISFFIVLMLFFALIAQGRLYGFQFVSVQDKTFSVVPYFVRSAAVFAAWTVGNWAVCTILSGEGTMRNICIYSAYSLVPFTVQIYINVILSHILVQDEAVFMEITAIIGTLWTAVMLFFAVKTVHGYSAPKTMLAIFLTIAAAAIMLVLLLLLLSLVQQICIFVSTLFTEIAYRVRS